MARFRVIRQRTIWERTIIDVDVPDDDVECIEGLRGETEEWGNKIVDAALSVGEHEYVRDVRVERIPEDPGSIEVTEGEGE